MVRTTINNGEVMLEVSGNVKELIADTCVFMRSMYQSIGEKSPEIAEEYKNFMLEMLDENNECYVFASREKLASETKRILNETKKELEEMLDRLLSGKDIDKERLDEIESIIKGFEKLTK